MKFLQRPQSSQVRKALFQIHLWTGVTVALYVVLVGVTGAALVFRQEYQAVTFPEFFSIDKGGQPDAPAAQIIGNLRERYPGYEVLGIDYPTGRRDSYLSYLTKGEQLVAAFSHPASGAVIGEMPKASWITKLQDLHFDLLAGSTGRTVNGIGALSLVAMFLTGLVVWWPGTDRWRQSLKIDFRNGWKRVNWDLHSATGFWLFGLLMLWAVTGVEFAFREPFRNVVNAISPLTEFHAPESAPGSGAADASQLVAKARAIVPDGKPGRVVLPSNERAAVLILMARVDHGDSDTSDEVDLYFDQHNGELLLRREPAAEYTSAGDLFMKWIGPIHVGSLGGPVVKFLWVILALSFPLLGVTGTLMWWNRVGRAFFRRQ